MSVDNGQTKPPSQSGERQNLPPEREFLHDVSSPLAVSIGNIRIIISKLSADPPAISGQALLEKLHKVEYSLEKLVTLVNLRRAAVNPPAGETIPKA